MPLTKYSITNHGWTTDLSETGHRSSSFVPRCSSLQTASRTVDAVACLTHSSQQQANYNDNDISKGKVNVDLYSALS